MTGNHGTSSNGREWLILITTLPPIAFWCWVLACFSLWAPLLCRLMRGKKHTDKEVEVVSPKHRQQRSSNSYKVRWFIVAISIPLFACSLMVSVNFVSMFLEPLHSTLLGSSSTAQYTLHQNDDDDAINVYIPGAGFSGFFYTLGRLQKLHTQSEDSSHLHQYHCFSAGCLALVASLLKLPIDHAIELAHESRDRWMAGEIRRYDVVEHFVDGLLSNIEHESLEVDSAVQEELAHYVRYTSTLQPSKNTTMNKTRGMAKQTQKHTIQGFLPRINVITSAWNNERWLSQRIQRPSSVKHLKKLLVQTTWIPFVTGPSFGHREIDETHYINDGAFAGLFQSFVSNQRKQEQHRFQPHRHQFSLLLPWNIDLLSNGLNMNLRHERAVHFWNEGLRRGVK